MKSKIYNSVTLLSLIFLFLLSSNSFASGQVYLSNLNWESSTIGWGNIHRDLSVDGNPLTLNDVVYEKGFGTHAISDIVFSLNGSCSNFQAFVGLDDEVPDNNSAANVVFNVYGDDILLFTSGTMTATSPNQFIDIDISGVSVLRLNLDDDNGSNNADHGDWADVIVTVSGELPDGLNRIKSPISLKSSNNNLEELFNWAKSKAYSFVRTGDNNNIPSYWAGLLHRPAFYLRDVAHQAIGAQILELDDENFSMIQTFALSANINRKYYPIWAFNFDGSIYSLDYHNDDDFVREVPQAFELTEQALELYRWTADENYINNSELFNFYTNSVTSFVDLHDENSNGIADDNWSQQGNIFMGTCTYNEQSADNFVEAGDGFAAQYKAYLAYAGILAARGDNAGYNTWLANAAGLRNIFGTDWYLSGQYARGMKINGVYGLGFDQMHISYPSRAGLTDMAERNTAALNLLFENGQSVYFVEARSYDAEIYFKYNQADRAWAMMNDVYNDERRNYPEISYVLVANCVTGMMGVDADAPNNKVHTCPRLPNDIDWLEIDSLKVGEQIIMVKHENNIKTSLTNKSNGTLNWQAQFYGHYSKLLLNGTPVEASTGSLNGQTISFINIELDPSQTDTVIADPLYLGSINNKKSIDRLIYPNPATNSIELDIDQSVKSVEIYSASAELLQTYDLLKTNKLNIDISRFSSGVYFVKYIEEENISTKMFIKQAL